MVCTLGFVSILVFAGILATAGSIFAIIFNDMVTRFHLPFLARPWISCIFWGIGWLVIMYIVALQSQHWWASRLGDYESDGVSWWFAFISTATVGLGDYYYQPEVMFGQDLLILSMLFLIGFVFLSAFLGKLSELVGSHLPATGSKLKKQLRRTNMWYDSEFEANAGNVVGGMYAAGGSTLQILQNLFDRRREEEEGDSPSDISAAKMEEELLRQLLREAQSKRRVLEKGLQPQNVDLMQLEPFLLKLILSWLDHQDLLQVECCCYKLRALSKQTRDHG